MVLAVREKYETLSIYDAIQCYKAGLKPNINRAQNIQKVFQPAFWCPQYPKADKNTPHNKKSPEKRLV